MKIFNKKAKDIFKVYNLNKVEGGNLYNYVKDFIDKESKGNKTNTEIFIKLVSKYEHVPLNKLLFIVHVYGFYDGFICCKNEIIKALGMKNA